MMSAPTSNGGYLELELPRSAEYHKAAIVLIISRNVMENILRVRGYKWVYLPCFSQ